MQLFRCLVQLAEGRRLRVLGARPEGGPPERFAAHVRAELARWAEVVRVNNIERITE